MSSDHLAWFKTGSTDSPISLTPRLSNSGFSRARAPSSVVQTGVKSLGWENNSAQLSPIQSWNLILPSVVSAAKSGATEPVWRGMLQPHVVQVTGDFALASIGRSSTDVNGRLSNGKDILSLAGLQPCPFGARACGERSQFRQKARLPRYCLLWSSSRRPRPCMAEPWACWVRRIGNHLQIEGW